MTAKLGTGNDHVAMREVDPHVLVPGDQIYVPGTGMGRQTAEDGTVSFGLSGWTDLAKDGSVWTIKQVGGSSITATCEGRTKTSDIPSGRTLIRIEPQEGTKR